MVAKVTHGFDRAAGPSPKTDSPAFKVEKRANNNRVIGFAVTLGNRDRQSPMPRRCPLEGDSVMRQGTAASFIIQHLPCRNCNSRVILDLPLVAVVPFPRLRRCSRQSIRGPCRTDPAAEPTTIAGVTLFAREVTQCSSPAGYPSLYGGELDSTWFERHRHDGAFRRGRTRAARTSVETGATRPGPARLRPATLRWCGCLACASIPSGCRQAKPSPPF